MVLRLVGHRNTNIRMIKYSTELLLKTTNNIKEHFKILHISIFIKRNTFQELSLSHKTEYHLRN